MKKLAISFLIFATLQIVYSQSGWFWQNPLPQGNDLYDIIYLNPGKIFAVGEAGTFIVSTNNGISWSIIHCLNGMRQSINSIFFVDQQTGWLAGGTMNYTNIDNISKILKTINGGTTWFEQFSGTDLNFNSIFFININTGWVTGNRIMKTTNGGQVWIDLGSLNNNPKNSVFFIDANTGWIVNYYSAGTFYSESTIKKTTNGGSNWINQYFCGSANGCQEMCDICFLNSTTGFAIGLTNLFSTTNGGDTWILSNYGGRDITFIDSQTGWITGLNIYKTTNAGLNWVNQGNSDCNAITFLNSNSGIAVGKFGNVLKTTNSGSNWIPFNQNIVNWLYKVRFINTYTGWACGEYGTLMKTTNSGNNWTNLYTAINNNLESLHFINENTGWLHASNTIRKSTDGGSTWFTQLVTAGDMDNDIYFFDLNTGIAVYSYNSLCRTSNSGLNWQITNISTNTGCLASSDSNTIFSGGTIIVKSTDRGMNWFGISMPAYSFVLSVSFSSQLTGWATCLQGKILKTIDNGENWALNYQFDDNGIYFRDIRFFNSNTGLAIGSFGIIIKTTNCGVNWYVMPKVFSEELISFSILNDSVGWIAGANGTILKTTDRGGSFVEIINYGNAIPTSFFLHQNYPNPFNPTTKIKFDIPLSRGLDGGAGRGVLVKLIIYDLLGREVTTLVNKRLKSGTYEVEWDGSSFASGVYFYKLIANDYVETRKMVLIK